VVQQTFVLVLYVSVAIVFGSVWCLALSIPISLASIVVAPSLQNIVFLAGASLLVSAITYPLLRRPLTRAKFFGWPILFSIAMAQAFGVIGVFVADWKANGSAPYSIVDQVLVAICAGIAYGTLYGLGSIHVAYPVAMAQLWALDRITTFGRRLWKC
jgi:hypothetical protein